MSSGILGRLKNKRLQEESSRKDSSKGERDLTISSTRAYVLKSPLIACSSAMLPSMLPSTQLGEVATRSILAFFGVMRKEKRDLFEYTYHVVHFAEAYMNREKVKELNKLSAIEAWKLLMERDQKVTCSIDHL